MKLSIAQIASICHDLNHAYCQAIGDHTQGLSYAALQLQWQSTVDDVRAIAEGRVRSAVGLHNDWVRRKAAEGWRYGPLNDPEAKLHACMVPWRELPSEQQIADELFFQTALTLLGLRRVS